MRKLLSYGLSTVLATHLYAQTIDVRPGWQLKGNGQEVNSNVFDNSCIDLVWKYDPKTLWQVYIPEPKTANIPSGLETFSSIDSNKGFWLKADTNCSIELNSINEIQVALNLLGSKFYAGIYYVSAYKNGYLILRRGNSLENTENEILIVNVANPNSIEDIKSIILPTTINEATQLGIGNISINDNNLYVGLGNFDDEFTFVYDMSNLSDPQKIGQMNGKFVVARNHILFLNSGTYEAPQLKIVDFSNNTENVLSTTNGIAISDYNFVLDGDFIYTTIDYNSFSVINISNLSQPQIAGGLQEGVYPKAKVGNTIYAFGMPSCLKGVDVSDPTAPNVVSNSLVCAEGNYSFSSIHSFNEQLLIGVDNYQTKHNFTKVYDTRTEGSYDIEEDYDGCNGAIIDNNQLFGTKTNYYFEGEDSNTTVKIFSLD
jgi:hypothetical protein